MELPPCPQMLVYGSVRSHNKKHLKNIHHMLRKDVGDAMKYGTEIGDLEKAYNTVPRWLRQRSNGWKC